MPLGWGLFSCVPGAQDLCPKILRLRKLKNETGGRSHFCISQAERFFREYLSTQEVPEEEHQSGLIYLNFSGAFSSWSKAFSSWSKAFSSWSKAFSSWSKALSSWLRVFSSCASNRARPLKPWFFECVVVYVFETVGGTAIFALACGAAGAFCRI